MNWPGSKMMHLTHQMQIRSLLLYKTSWRDLCREGRKIYIYLREFKLPVIHQTKPHCWPCSDAEHFNQASTQILSVGYLNLLLPLQGPFFLLFYSRKGHSCWVCSYWSDEYSHIWVAGSHKLQFYKKIKLCCFVAISYWLLVTLLLQIICQRQSHLKSTRQLSQSMGF